MQKTIRSRQENIETAVNWLENWLREQHIDEDRLGDIVIAASEAITNAIVHGNREDPERTVTVTLTTVPEGIHVRVRDEGTGFQRAAVPDPLQSETFMETSGRGLLIMESLSDRVVYRNGGREVDLFFALDEAND